MNDRRKEQSGTVFFDLGDRITPVADDPFGHLSAPGTEAAHAAPVYPDPGMTDIRGIARSTASLGLQGVYKATVIEDSSLRRYAPDVRDSLASAIAELAVLARSVQKIHSPVDFYSRLRELREEEAARHPSQRHLIFERIATWLLHRPVVFEGSDGKPETWTIMRCPIEEMLHFVTPMITLRRAADGKVEEFQMVKVFSGLKI